MYISIQDIWRRKVGAGIEWENNENVKVDTESLIYKFILFHYKEIQAIKNFMSNLIVLKLIFS